MTTSTPDSIQQLRARNYISQTVASHYDFSINHDVDGIVNTVWKQYGHFDFELIDVDAFQAIVDDHEFYPEIG